MVVLSNLLKWSPLGLFSVVCVTSVYAQDFTDLSLDDLMQIEVTSVSKKPEKLSNAAAAVYVVTQNEIRRSGATSVPEVLKFVPGMQVAQIDTNKWAIGMRGFNGRQENKLLVLIDGRTVFTSTYSGVFWENHEYILEDIERIEVIRGPGATLWGANAVNGVINIITKDAADTVGTFVELAAGNELKGMASGRFGAELSDNTQMRVYAKTRKLDSAVDTNGDELNTDGDYLQSGFRMDWQGDASQMLTLQGDLFDHSLDQDLDVVLYSAPFGTQNLIDTVETEGGNLSAKWTQLTGLDSELTVHAWYDYYQREDIRYDERLDTYDMSFQHQFKLFNDNSVVWGGGYRWSENDIDSGTLISVEDSEKALTIWNFFVQDTIAFPEQNISVTLGSKFEDNTYSGSEIQPNVRMSWVPSGDFTAWGAISRAKRIPSRGETDFVITPSTVAPNDYVPLPQMVQVNGSPLFDAEEVDAYELGLRWIPQQDVAFDLALYYNEYSDLRSYELEDGYINDSGFLVYPLTLANNISGNSYGSELLATWQATRSSRYKLSYSYNEVELSDSAYSVFSDDLIDLVENRAPQHQVSFWASYDPAMDWELDIRVFYKDSQDWSLDDSGGIDAFTNADVRIGWQATSWAQVALIGKNILHDSQEEFDNSETGEVLAAMERSVFANVKMDW